LGFQPLLESFQHTKLTSGQAQILREFSSPQRILANAANLCKSADGIRFHLNFCGNTWNIMESPGGVWKLNSIKSTELPNRILEALALQALQHRTLLPLGLIQDPFKIPLNAGHENV
jgi:hypothetical protein